MAVWLTKGGAATLISNHGSNHAGTDYRNMPTDNISGTVVWTVQAVLHGVLYPKAHKLETEFTRVQLPLSHRSRDGCTSNTINLTSARLLRRFGDRLGVIQSPVLEEELTLRWLGV